MERDHNLCKILSYLRSLYRLLFFGALILYRPVPPEVFSLHIIKFHDMVEVRNQRGQRSNDFTWRILGGRPISSTLSFLFLLASSSCFDCWIWSFKSRLFPSENREQCPPPSPLWFSVSPFFLSPRPKLKLALQNNYVRLNPGEKMHRMIIPIQRFFPLVNLAVTEFSGNFL